MSTQRPIAATFDLLAKQLKGKQKRPWPFFIFFLLAPWHIFLLLFWFVF
jgi:hypothetical protein